MNRVYVVSRMFRESHSEWAGGLEAVHRSQEGAETSARKLREATDVDNRSGAPASEPWKHEQSGGVQTWTRGGCAILIESPVVED